MPYPLVCRGFRVNSFIFRHVSFRRSGEDHLKTIDHHDLKIHYGYQYLRTQ